MCNQQVPLIIHGNMMAANPLTNPSAKKYDFLKHFLIVSEAYTKCS
jgi:hypothetical protein